MLNQMFLFGARPFRDWSFKWISLPPGWSVLSFAYKWWNLNYFIVEFIEKQPQKGKRCLKVPRTRFLFLIWTFLCWLTWLCRLAYSETHAHQQLLNVITCGFYRKRGTDIIFQLQFRKISSTCLRPANCGQGRGKILWLALLGPIWLASLISWRPATGSWSTVLNHT